MPVVPLPQAVTNKMSPDIRKCLLEGSTIGDWEALLLDQSQEKFPKFLACDWVSNMKIFDLVQG